MKLHSSIEMLPGVEHVQIRISTAPVIEDSHLTDIKYAFTPTGCADH